MPYNPAADAAGASNFVEGLTKDERLGAAYNALAQSQGPVAAYGLIDPEGVMGAAKGAVAQQTIPQQVQQAQSNLTGTNLENTGKQLANDQTANQARQMAAYRAGAIVSAHANPDGSIPPDTFDKFVRPHPELYGIKPEDMDAVASQLTSPGGVQHVHGFMQSMLGPSKASGAMVQGKDAAGNDVLYGRDQWGNLITQGLNGGSTVQNNNADTKAGTLTERQTQDAWLRQHGFTDDLIRQYHENTGANNTLYGNTQGPLNVVRPPNAGGAAPTGAPGTLPGDKRPSANFGGGNTLPKPTTDLINAGNPPGTTTPPAVPQLSGKPLATRTSQAQMVANANTNFGTANQVISALNQQANAYNTGAGSWLDWLHGSSAANVRANASALRGQVGSAIISSMKNAQGQMGFRMTNAEFKTLTDSLGALGTEQSQAQFKQHLGYIANAIGQFNQTMNSGFKTQFQTDPYSALGMQPPGGQSGNSPQKITSNAGWAALPKGTQYMAPDGKVRVKQ